MHHRRSTDVEERGTADRQRRIVPALLAVLSGLSPSVRPQVLAASVRPQVLAASVRPQVLAARRASEASMAAQRSSG